MALVRFLDKKIIYRTCLFLRAFFLSPSCSTTSSVAAVNGLLSCDWPFSSSETVKLFHHTSNLRRIGSSLSQIHSGNFKVQVEPCSKLGRDRTNTLLYHSVTNSIKPLIYVFEFFVDEMFRTEETAALLCDETCLEVQLRENIDMAMTHLEKLQLAMNVLQKWGWPAREDTDAYLAFVCPNIRWRYTQVKI